MLTKSQKELELASDNLHERVAGRTAVSRRERALMRNDGLRGLVYAQQLPADRFVVADSAANLPSLMIGLSSSVKPTS